MDGILDFISEYFYVYLWQILTAGINIIAPISASTVVNPVTAFFTDPQRAIGIGAFAFFCTGLHRVYLFRRELVSDETNVALIKKWLPYSIAGALTGGFLITNLNEKVLAVIIILMSSYFIVKTVYYLITEKKEVRKESSLTRALIFVVSGFMQGSGMQGGDLRNNYLRTFVSEVSVRAVGSAFGLVNFFIAGSVILLQNHLTIRDIIFIITLVPFLMIAQIYGVKFLVKLKDRNAKIIAITLSVLGVVLLTHKYLL
jgi:uncharacterized membrane protein YfcA